MNRNLTPYQGRPKPKLDIVFNKKTIWQTVHVNQVAEFSCLNQAQCSIINKHDKKIVLIPS